MSSQAPHTEFNTLLRDHSLCYRDGSLDFLVLITLIFQEPLLLGHGILTSAQVNLE